MPIYTRPTGTLAQFIHENGFTAEQIRLAHQHLVGTPQNATPDHAILRIAEKMRQVSGSAHHPSPPCPLCSAK